MSVTPQCTDSGDTEVREEECIISDSVCSCSSDTCVCREECIISVGDSMYVTQCVFLH